MGNLGINKIGHLSQNKKGENTVIGRKIDVTKLMCRYNNTWYDVISLDIPSNNAVIKNSHGSLDVPINAIEFYVENLDWRESENVHNTN